MAVVLGIKGRCNADIWDSDAVRLVVSDSGEYYMIAETTNDDAVSLGLWKVLRGGSAPVAGGWDSWDEAERGGCQVRSSGDTMIWKISHEQIPVDIKVLDGGRGVVLFEKHGAIGFGDSLTLIGGNGTIQWKRKLNEIMSRVITSSVGVTGSIWWY
ncbi:MAG: hypothetical protein L6R43_06395, partial [Planctomycetes bacterium]|nr:hypothetical protein [Planctomycetota bacterium]